jgi:hypothetical protein
MNMTSQGYYTEIREGEKRNGNGGKLGEEKMGGD